MIGIPERNRADDERIDDGEHCGREADGEGEHPGGGQCEAPMRGERSRRLPDILPDRFEGHRADVADGLFRLCESAQFTQGHAARIGGCHAAGDVRLGLHLDVERQLVVELALGAPPLEQAAQRRHEWHVDPHSACRSLRMARANSRQSSASADRRFRPAAVSV